MNKLVKKYLPEAKKKKKKLTKKELEKIWKKWLPKDRKTTPGIEFSNTYKYLGTD